MFRVAESLQTVVHLFFLSQNKEKPFQQKLGDVDAHLHELLSMYEALVEKNMGAKPEVLDSGFLVCRWKPHNHF